MGRLQGGEISPQTRTCRGLAHQSRPRHPIQRRPTGRLYSRAISRNPLGQALHALFEVVLSNEDVVLPDLLFVSNERSGIWTEKNAEGAPDLIIEILSETTRRTDETRKFRLYERAGVREYWMFDADREAARAFRREGDRLVLVQNLSAAAGNVLETPLLPGLRIPLAEVFR